MGSGWSRRSHQYSGISDGRIEALAIQDANYFPCTTSSTSQVVHGHHKDPSLCIQLFINPRPPKHWEVGVQATENGRLLLPRISRSSQMNISADFFGRSIWIIFWESFCGVYTILLQIFLKGLYGSFFGSLNNLMWKVYMNIAADFFLHDSARLR
ncbi:hypothetical protein H6P81_017929 [Aristolochia fimbriata]|uniref:Uncharacterized protein n=1 Tax=Aristolochia fimbriata TaxID=158543 RepID=A0AAV7E1L3_ARIFI|nr:hypothetical protein H6P81_017929 [Aristolochia fimbriata]